MTEPYLQDADCTLYHGDVLDVLAGLPDESVDCVVTSPPYWGLRDYGTGAWEGGDESCDHKPPARQPRSERPDAHGFGTRSVLMAQDEGATTYRDVCGRCGARRVDQQIGLEPTPDAFVASLVAVFREVRRVLAPHGTCWINLGSSYSSGDRDGHGTRIGAKQGTNRASAENLDNVRPPQPAGFKPKDMVPIPWMVAMALQADGWYLRADIIWAKPNPMPESVTDRPTKSHEYVFLLTKQPRYYFDQEAVREPHETPPELRRQQKTRVYDPQVHTEKREYLSARGGGNDQAYNPAGRNIRSVWTIATQPYPDAHFATFPEELVRRCILAGTSSRGVCPICRQPWVRDEKDLWHLPCGHAVTLAARKQQIWAPAVVLDPFVGSGTTCKVARDHGRHSIGIDLNANYLELAARRLQQQSLLTEAGA